MSNSEIYDPSNSDLSSDEYATEEDDDALMDAAVSKQPPPPPPKETQSSVESSSMPEKASVLASTKPPGSSVELPLPPTPMPAPNDKGTKPPATRKETLLRIRQIRARKKNFGYYKNRSVRWLRKLHQFPNSKLDDLKKFFPLYKAHYKRLADFWSDRAAYRQLLLVRQSYSSSSRSRSCSHSRSNSRSRSRFRSRSRSESNSLELICLDDTENEDSPEKVEPAQTARQMSPVKEDKEKSIPLRQIEFDKKPPPLAPENGSVLDEFLTMKPPINQILKQQVDKEITAYELAQFSAAMKQLTENTQQQPKEEAPTTVAPNEPLKRRRSVTPPPLTSSQDKRPRPIPDPDDDDDDRIEFIPVVQPAQESPNRALVTPQQYLQPQMQRPQHPPVQEKPQQQQLQQPLKDKPQQQPQQPQQQQPPPQIQMQIQKRKPQHPQQHHPLQPQVPQPHSQPLQHKPQKLQPDPKVQHPQSQHPHPQNQQPQQTLQQKPLQDPRSPGFQLGTPYSLAPVAGSGSGAIQQAVNLTAMAYSLNTPSPQAVPMEISYPTAKLPQTAANPMNLQMPTQAHQPRAPPPASPQPQIQPQAQTFAVPQQPKPRRSETVSTQTPKTAQAPQPAAQNQIPSTAQNPSLGRPKPPLMDLGNDDANFHYHLLSLYEEMDTQLKAKISQVKPELKALAKERERIEFEMKNLDRQILKHEDEGNRLQYLRLVQNELRIRLERKERLAIIKSMVPNLIGQNCSISELSEMQAMLALNTEDAAAVSMERCLNKMEQNRSNIEVLRSALGLKAPEREPTASPTHRQAPRQMEEFPQHRSRNSLPPLRGSTHDINNFFDSKRHSEERSAPSSNLGHIFSQTQNSQRLPNSPSLEILTGRQGHVRAQVQTPPHHRSQSSLHCPSGIENLIMPLYNSSPLAGQQRKHDEMHSNYNNESYSSGGQQPQTNTQPQCIAKTFDNRSNRLQTSGPGEGVIMMNGQGGEHNCMECGKNQADFICANCKVQCYCSRECQLRDWDAHYPLCGQ
ncbi:bromodomain-containing protein 4 isoform X2 [Drosophila miranda]|nr:bromodomain-containing protein 4 isoform X2 [Drosophila miranda]XP_033242813.1 bromodomain-containing protein 4 isoform X2 [Drosophila miranda]